MFYDVHVRGTALVDTVYENTSDFLQPRYTNKELKASTHTGYSVRASKLLRVYMLGPKSMQMLNCKLKNITEATMFIT
jgi:hypothetical protein